MIKSESVKRRIKTGEKLKALDMHIHFWGKLAMAHYIKYIHDSGNPEWLTAI